MNETILIIAIVAVLIPFVIFLSVKLGTVAFYVGRKHFNDKFGDKNE